jgi:hypothetical protein
MSRESWNKREWRYNPTTLASGWVEVLEGGNPIVETGNVQVEFPWGNVPLQPNDDRTGLQSVNNGPEDVQWSSVLQQVSSALNPTLDNHSIATGLPPYRFPGWNGYPGYLPNDIDNLPGSFVVPDVTGLSNMDAGYTLAFAGFGVTVNYVNNAGGATTQNNDKVASQSPTAGHTIERGSTVTINVYQYVAPEVQVFAWNGADYISVQFSGQSYESLGVIFNPFFAETDGTTALLPLMVAASPSIANNGWANLYLRCNNVTIGGGKTFIANGDYLITSSLITEGKSVVPYFETNMPLSALSGESVYAASITSGTLSIIQK